MKKSLYFMLAAIMFVACGKNDFDFNLKQEVKNPYAITPEEAVELLQTVIGGETTRSISVSDIQTLSKGNFVPTTRSDANEDAIYIVDIEGGGSAIMSADKRMEPIYAILDKTKISAEKLIGANTRSSSDEEEDIEDYILWLLNSAIQYDIQEAGLRGPEMPLIPRDLLWDVTTVTARKDPLLKTAWHQRTPYNDNYPQDTSGEKYPAGCGPIALAQILYYHRFPNSIDGVTFDWNLIEDCEIENYPPSNSAKIEVANFVYQIASNIEGIEYTEDSKGDLVTIISINKARKFLQEVGYTNPTVVDYSLSSAINMVTNNRPFFILGVDSNSDENFGHFWVIDGCKVYKIDHWVRRYTDATSFSEYIENTSYYNLVHCNFGWGDNDDWNGDYTSGIFNPLVGDERHNYNTGLKMITYSLNN